MKIECFKLFFHHDVVVFTYYAGQVCDSTLHWITLEFNIAAS